MKVIFLQDVPKIAKVGEIKEVTEGYGRNFLIPRKLALAANPAAINLVKTQLAGEAHSQARTEAELMEMANQLDGKEVAIEAKAGGKERLYGSITTADIAAALKTATGLAIDKRKIELNEPIHRIGKYEVTIKLAQNIVPKITVTVSGKQAEKASGD